MSVMRRKVACGRCHRPLGTMPWPRGFRWSEHPLDRIQFDQIELLQTVEGSGGLKYPGKRQRLRIEDLEDFHIRLDSDCECGHSGRLNFYAIPAGDGIILIP